MWVRAGLGTAAGLERMERDVLQERSLRKAVLRLRIMIVLSSAIEGTGLSGLPNKPAAAGGIGVQGVMELLGAASVQILERQDMPQSLMEGMTMRGQSWRACAPSTRLTQALRASAVR
jgi:hypothetical protein